MRKFVLASFGALIVAVAGCSSPNGTVLTSEQAVVIETTQPGLVSLQAGGLSIRSAGDTAINFDLVPNASVYNDSNAALHLLAKWALACSGLVKPNEQTATNGYLIIDSGTIDLGIVPTGSSVALDSIPIVTLSDSDLHGGQLAYQLQFQVQNGPVLTRNYHMNGVPDSISSVSNPLIFYAYNLSVPFTSRYRGIIYTTEASPTPISIIDGPDNADWVGDSIIMPSPAYPNPATGTTMLGFTIPSSLDSLRGDLYITPHHILKTFLSGPLKGAGSHEVSLNLAGISPGLYQVHWTALKNGAETTSHGNIMVPLP